MALTKNANGEFVIKPREPGFEQHAATPFISPDISGDGTFAGFDGILELGAGGFVGQSISSTLLTTLDTIPQVRAGLITKAEQRSLILYTVWSNTQKNVPAVLVIASVLAIAPWLMPVASVAGVVGMGFMATRLTRAAIGALSDEQVESLKAKAAEIGVDLPGLDREGPEPVPTFS